jgi:hypothetical protein
LHDRVVERVVRDFGAGFGGEHGIGRANQTAYDQIYAGLGFEGTPRQLLRFSPAYRPQRSVMARRFV